MANHKWEQTFFCTPAKRNLPSLSHPKHHIHRHPYNSARNTSPNVESIQPSPSPIIAKGNDSYREHQDQIPSQQHHSCSSKPSSICKRIFQRFQRKHQTTVTAGLDNIEAEASLF
jgi:hypothetical protein